MLRDHRRIFGLELHESPPRAPTVTFFNRDVCLLNVARLGVHLDSPHVSIVVGVDLCSAVIAPAVAAIGTQLHIRGDAGF